MERAPPARAEAEIGAWLGVSSHLDSRNGSDTEPTYTWRRSLFRGNLHRHSNKSDGLLKPEDVAAAYHDAGYGFITLSDHFEAEYGWQVTDTRHLRDAGFTTLLGAELSSAAWTERNVYWVTAAVCL